MITVEQMRNVAQDLIASYDDRVDAIGTIIDDTYQVLDDFKNKRAKLSSELKETLARRQSLRKKDFDRMMNGILLSQEEKEKEVKQNLKDFVKEQKKEARELRDALSKGEVQKMKKAQIGIENGIVEIKELLRNFYEQQKGLIKKFTTLLTKGKDLKIKDLKDVIRDPQTLTRGKEVKRMGLSNVATDIKALAQDMATSHADRAVSGAERIASIEALSEEVREMIRTFQKEHAERKVEVTQTLESFTENLHKGVHQFMKDIHQFMKGLHSENAQKRAEVNDLLVSFQEYMKDVRKENAQRQREVNKLLENVQKEMEGFQKENKLRHSEVGRLVAAVKEMWSTVAGAKRGAKKVSARYRAETEGKKPARKAKGRSKKVQGLWAK
jgi:hypothetical protein